MYVQPGKSTKFNLRSDVVRYSSFSKTNQAARRQPILLIKNINLWRSSYDFTVMFLKNLLNFLLYVTTKIWTHFLTNPRMINNWFKNVSFIWYLRYIGLGFVEYQLKSIIFLKGQLDLNNYPNLCKREKNCEKLCYYVLIQIPFDISRRMGQYSQRNFHDKNYFIRWTSITQENSNPQ